MKRLKSYRKFNESSLCSKSTIEDFLLDFSDKGVTVRVDEGTWSLLSKPVPYINVTLINGQNLEFTLEPCLLELLDYMEDCGLFLMETSRWWNDKWQHYVGCPNCLSEDIEDNYNLTMKTKCNNCGVIEPADSFLLEEWPLNREIIEQALVSKKRCEMVQLTFSDRVSFYTKIKESVEFSELQEIRYTIRDMLLELSFLDIKSRVWLVEDLCQIELRKEGFSDKNGFSWHDVSRVIDAVSEYLSDWGFVAQWQGEPDSWVKTKLDEEEQGYKSILILTWKCGGV